MKILLFYKMLVILFIVFSFLASEIMLRLFGLAYPYNISTLNDEIKIMKYDSTLGWLPKKGKYVHQKGNGNINSISYNFMEDGRRITSSSMIEKNKKIVIVGCSYTQGWAISDNQTFAWKLQDKLKSKDFEVMNYGVGAYGTYQSLLMLERINKLLEKPPELVIYGLFDHHDERNIASSDWMQSIFRDGKKLNMFKVPYVSLGDNGEIIRHKPEELRPWFGRSSSAIIYFIEKLYLDFYLYRNRDKNKEILTEKLILEMNNFVEKKMESKLLIIHLESWGYYDYKIFLNRNKKIKYLDCTSKNIHQPGWFVEGDGHPNEKMNTYWAEQIYNDLKNRIF